MSNRLKMSPKELAHMFHGVPSGNGALVPGEGHSPDDRSLHITFSDTDPDGFIVHSHSGDDDLIQKDYVRSRLQSAGYTNGHAQPAKASRSLIETYPYTDERGDLLFQVRRYHPKAFSQRAPDGLGGWLYKLDGVRRVLYRFPELLEAVASDHPIFIAEGEKAVNALVKLGVSATCSPHGAGKWRLEYSRHLKGADVIILPDNDAKGTMHAEMVSKLLKGIAASVTVLRLPNLPPEGDADDWIKAGGTIEQLWELVEAERKPAAEPEADKAAPPKQAGLVILCAADVLPVPVEWTWKGRLARGKVSLITGNPDLGKSQVAAYCVGRITTGKHWPQGERAPQGSVIILATEDGIADTWVPRLMAAEVDLARVHFVKMVIDDNGNRRTFNLQSDLDALAKKIAELADVQLIIVDPITAYMGKADTKQTGDVRSIMTAVGDFAEESRVAILALTHPPKAQANAMNAFTGSLAFVAGARIAFLITEEPETGRKLMLAVKNNVGIKAQGRGYTISAKMVTDKIEAPYVVWDDAPVDVTADQAIAASCAANKNPGAISEAKEFLSATLAGGSVDADEVIKEAKALGISEITLRRAKSELGVVAAKDSFRGPWQWALPVRS
jgi:putative DNA primase/helicase